ncbi:hypothetical protein ACO229_03665 [Promicromonospora sp. MS192]|uniref:hypothetical protein n=1 Tax=Promicromonospora sp. MS192 TaxID=3412684 RepID=UPI003C2C669A
MATDGWTWQVEQPEGWLLVPAAGMLPPDELARWEREVAAMIHADLDDEPGTGRGTGPDAGPGTGEGEALHQLYAEVAARSVANLRAFADGVVGSGARVVATLRVPDVTPVPVLVTVGVEPPGDAGDDLMTALGSTGGHPVAPPTIEHLDLPDGDGMRVTRLDLDAATGGAWMSVCLGRRTEHPDAVVDTVLQWRSPDLLRAPAMTKLLDELLPAVRVTRSTP